MKQFTCLSWSPFWEVPPDIWSCAVAALKTCISDSSSSSSSSSSQSEPQDSPSSSHLHLLFFAGMFIESNRLRLRSPELEFDNWRSRAISFSWKSQRSFSWKTFFLSLSCFVYFTALYSTTVCCNCLESSSFFAICAWSWDWKDCNSKMKVSKTSLFPSRTNATDNRIVLDKTQLAEG